MSSISISVEWQDSMGEMHAQYLHVQSVPHTGDTVVIEHQRFRVINVVHLLFEDRIVICTERTK